MDSLKDFNMNFFNFMNNSSSESIESEVCRTNGTTTSSSESSADGSNNYNTSECKASINFNEAEFSKLTLQTLVKMDHSTIQKVSGVHDPKGNFFRWYIIGDSRMRDIIYGWPLHQSAYKPGLLVKDDLTLEEVVEFTMQSVVIPKETNQGIFIIYSLGIRNIIKSFGNSPNVFIVAENIIRKMKQIKQTLKVKLGSNSCIVFTDLLPIDFSKLNLEIKFSPDVFNKKIQEFSNQIHKITYLVSRNIVYENLSIVDGNYIRWTVFCNDLDMSLTDMYSLNKSYNFSWTDNKFKKTIILRLQENYELCNSIKVDRSLFKTFCISQKVVLLSSCMVHNVLHHWPKESTYLKPKIIIDSTLTLDTAVKIIESKLGSLKDTLLVIHLSINELIEFIFEKSCLDHDPLKIILPVTPKNECDIRNMFLEKLIAIKKTFCEQALAKNVVFTTISPCDLKKYQKILIEKHKTAYNHVIAAVSKVKSDDTKLIVPQVSLLNNILLELARSDGLPGWDLIFGFTIFNESTSNEPCPIPSSTSYSSTMPIDIASTLSKIMTNLIEETYKCLHRKIYIGTKMDIRSVDISKDDGTFQQTIGEMLADHIQEYEDFNSRPQSHPNYKKFLNQNSKILNETHTEYKEVFQILWDKYLVEQSKITWSKKKKCLELSFSKYDCLLDEKKSINFPESKSTKYVNYLRLPPSGDFTKQLMSVYTSSKYSGKPGSTCYSNIRSPSPYTKKRSPSPYTKRRSPSPFSKRRSPSPYTKKRSPSPFSKRRSPSPYTKRRSPSPFSKRRSPSPYTKKRSPSLYTKRRSPSPYSKRRSQSQRTRLYQQKKLSHTQYLKKPSQSPNSRKRSQSTNSRKQSQSPNSRKLSQSPYSKKRSHSPNSRKRSQSPYSKKQSHSPNSTKRSQSPYSKKQSHSPNSTKWSQSPNSRKRSLSPYSKKLSPSQYTKKKKQKKKKSKKSLPNIESNDGNNNGTSQSPGDHSKIRKETNVSTEDEKVISDNIGKNTSVTDSVAHIDFTVLKLVKNFSGLLGVAAELVINIYNKIVDNQSSGKNPLLVLDHESISLIEIVERKLREAMHSSTSLISKVVMEDIADRLKSFTENVSAKLKLQHVDRGLNIFQISRATLNKTYDETINMINTVLEMHGHCNVPSHELSSIYLTVKKAQKDITGMSKNAPQQHGNDQCNSSNISARSTNSKSNAENGNSNKRFEISEGFNTVNPIVNIPIESSYKMKSNVLSLNKLNATEECKRDNIDDLKTTLSKLPIDKQIEMFTKFNTLAMKQRLALTEMLSDIEKVDPSLAAGIHSIIKKGKHNKKR